MIPILLHGQSGNAGYSYDSFETEFFKICELHRKQNRALAFALLLYDLTNPQISKVLRDSDYWKALNKIAGRYLTVFSFHYKSASSDHGDSLYWMTKIDVDQLISGRSLLDKYFELEKEVQLPAILFFQVSDNEIIGTSLVQLKEVRIEEAFLEIKEILTVAAESVAEVDEKNYGNDFEIFNLIQNGINNRGINVFVKKAFNTIKNISDVVSIFK